MRVANKDLRVSLQNSTQSRSRDIVFCILEMDDYVHFLLGSKFISLC